MLNCERNSTNWRGKSKGVQARSAKYFEGDQFIPHLIVSDGPRALKFYRDVLGAEEGDNMMVPDGKRLMHGEIIRVSTSS